MYFIWRRKGLTINEIEIEKTHLFIEREYYLEQNEGKNRVYPTNRRSTLEGRETTENLQDIERAARNCCVNAWNSNISEAICEKIPTSMLVKWGRAWRSEEKRYTTIVFLRFPPQLPKARSRDFRTITSSFDLCSIMVPALVRTAW